MTLSRRAFSLCAVLTLFLSSLANGTTENTLYAFGTPGSGDGMYPFCSPVFDTQGNVYGTTLLGGTHNAGTVFELSPGQNGQWVETVLYEFTGRSDGGYPIAGLVFDSKGNLYGTGQNGGANGTGVVFELSPQGGGWTYRVLYSFGPYPGSDGFGPNSALAFDALGNLYGTTYQGGNVGCFEGCGTVFELSPTGNGGWNEQVLHAFETNGIDGELPAGVAVASNGALYGTTQNGGTSGSGVLYRLKYSPIKKQWVENILHQFVGGSNDGAFPESAVLINGSTLYGTTEGGGTASDGTVFETTLSEGWPTTVLYSFNTGFDGSLPQAGLTIDKKGNLYGTTFQGGTYGSGIVFELSKSNGQWAETILYSFNGTDGLYPQAAVTIKDIWLYGTTRLGGNTSGVVFQVQFVLAATTSTVTPSPNPSSYGQAVVFTAVVTSSIGAPPDGETVTFKQGATVLGTGTLSGGTASMSISTLGVGSHTITAVYGGDSKFAANTSKAVKQVVSRATTTTALASSLNPSSVGQSVAFTASVAPQFSGTVKGTVTFYDGTTLLKTVSLIGGVAKFTTKTLASGVHTVTATYNGNATFIGSSASLTQTVN